MTDPISLPTLSRSVASLAQRLHVEQRSPSPPEAELLQRYLAADISEPQRREARQLLGQSVTGGPTQAAVAPSQATTRPAQTSTGELAKGAFLLSTGAACLLAPETVVPCLAFAAATLSGCGDDGGGDAPPVDPAATPVVIPPRLDTPASPTRRNLALLERQHPAVRALLDRDAYGDAGLVDHLNDVESLGSAQGAELSADEQLLVLRGVRAALSNLALDALLEDVDASLQSADGRALPLGLPGVIALGRGDAAELRETVAAYVKEKVGAGDPALVAALGDAIFELGLRREWQQPNLAAGLRELGRILTDAGEDPLVRDAILTLTEHDGHRVALDAFLDQPFYVREDRGTSREKIRVTAIETHAAMAPLSSPESLAVETEADARSYLSTLAEQHADVGVEDVAALATLIEDMLGRGILERRKDGVWALERLIETERRAGNTTPARGADTGLRAVMYLKGYHGRIEYSPELFRGLVTAYGELRQRGEAAHTISPVFTEILNTSATFGMDPVELADIYHALLEQLARPSLALAALRDIEESAVATSSPPSHPQPRPLALAYHAMLDLSPSLQGASDLFAYGIALAQVSQIPVASVLKTLLQVAEAEGDASPAGVKAARAAMISIVSVPAQLHDMAETYVEHRWYHQSAAATIHATQLMLRARAESGLELAEISRLYRQLHEGVAQLPEALGPRRIDVDARAASDFEAMLSDGTDLRAAVQAYLDQR